MASPEVMDTTGPPQDLLDQMTTTTLDDRNSQLLAHYYHISERLFIIVSPIILIVGWTGNILTLIIMQRPSLCRSSVAVYLSALAVSDSLVLALDFINNWFKMALNVYVLGSSHSFCRFHRYVFDAIFTYSSWLVVAVSLERFIVVWFPLQAKTWCTVRSARITASVLPIFCLLLYMYKAFAWHIDDDGACNMRIDFEEFESNVGPWITGTFYSYIPILVLIIVNILIVSRLSRMASERAGMTSEGGANNPRSAKEQRITITVITVCVVFIMSTLPLSLFYILQFAIGEYINQSPKIALGETIILIIGLCNYAVNFFLYVLTSKGFRKELKAIFCCCRGLDKKADTSGSVDSNMSRATEQSTIKNTVM